MLAAIKKPLDPEARAAMVRSLAHWWHGGEPPARQSGPTGPRKGAIEPDPETPPRVQALEKIWGRGRYMPGTLEIDAELIALLGLAEDARIGALGVSPQTLRAAPKAMIEVYEWRRELAGRTAAKLTGIASVYHTDLDRPRWTGEQFDGLISSEALSFADHKPGTSAAAFRALPPGGRWVMVEYCGEVAPPPAAFASAFSEPQIVSRDQIVDILEEIGFIIEAEEDVSAPLVEAAGEGFHRLAELMTKLAQADAEEAADRAIMLRELAWEAETWKARRSALRSGRLSAMRFIARKPGESEERAAMPASSQTAAASADNKSGATEKAPSSDQTPKVVEETDAEADDGLDQSSVDALFD
jgi:hypothetical protein